MHKRVSRLPHSIEPRKAAVLFGEQVTKLFERPPQILRRVGPFHAVMQMNLHFAEAVRFQFGQSLDERAVILLGGIKVGVAERRPIAVSRQRRPWRGLAYTIRPRARAASPGETLPIRSSHDGSKWFATTRMRCARPPQAILLNVRRANSPARHNG